ncbi:uncharacterized protein LOC112566171 [Pomacea canaliculata]|uniref:uncharacterized protein LOC112566171 n=1 Tax=Pomacea canaliculata TaxID=400727 RepID=UPI000D7300B9|nr:uncharacterized protein LOC112566171 [Pomacea canaliculata]
MSCINHSTTSDYQCVSTNSSNDDTMMITRLVVEVVFDGGVGTFKCLMGMTTNAINCLVFWRQGLGDRMNLSLFSLALADFCYFAVTLPAFSLPSFIRFYDNALYEEYKAHTLASVVALTKMLSIVACVYVVVSTPSLVLQKVETVVYACLGTLATLVGVPTNVLNCLLFWREGLRDRMNVCLFSLALAHVFPVVILTVVTVATIVTVKTLRTAMMWRENTSCVADNVQKRQVALNKMLTMVAIVFIVTYIPLVAL